MTAADRLERAIGLLEDLVAFDTTSSRSNLELIDYVSRYLARFGLDADIAHDEGGDKACLFVTVGSAFDGGVVLCGHSDVVPVCGQQWASDPFRVRREADRLHGRGTADMKGFIACALAMVPALAESPLARPVHLALSFDEEVGALGAPLLASRIRASGLNPAAAIVGEPTGMRPIAGHKGGVELTTRIAGVEAHASDPRRGVNAIHYAARFIAELERVAARLAAAPRAGCDFDPAHSTLSVGTIRGGTARNVVAGQCSFDWELRTVPGDDGEAIVQRLRSFAREVLEPEMRGTGVGGSIVTEVVAAYPGLDPEPGSAALSLAAALTGSSDYEVVAYGSDAGHLQQAGVPAVLLGPGFIDQAHRPDEYVDVDQLRQCLAMLGRLREMLCRPG